MGIRGGAFGRRRALAPVGVAAALLLAAGCGNGDDEGARTPLQQCTDMVDTYCAKVAECAPPSDRTARGADCETALGLLQGCDQVVGVEGRMSDCLHAVDAIDCHSYDPSMKSPPWPDACHILVGSP